MKGVRPASLRVREAQLCVHTIEKDTLCLQREHDHLHTPDPKCKSAARHHDWTPDLKEIRRVRRELMALEAAFA